MSKPKLLTGDVLAKLKTFPDNHFDGLLSDPPYALSFMGQAWDASLPSVEVWREVFRVLKPGAPLLVFGGTRTYHRQTCHIEDAGFEIRDCLMWLYGSGFPKSQNVSKAIDAAAGAQRKVVGSRTLLGSAALSTKEKGGTYAANTSSAGRSIAVPITAPETLLAKQWDGTGTALKPAVEPIVLARKPLAGTMVENVTTWGCGPLAIDACRIRRDPNDTSGWSETGSHASDNRAMSGANTERAPKPDNEGRWPANLLLSHSTECEHIGNTTVKTGTAKRDKGGKNFGSNTNKPSLPDMSYGIDGKETVEAWVCSPFCPVALLDAQSGHGKSKPFPANDATGSVLPLTHRTAGGYSDSGGASRFFYCGKVSKSERGEGNNHACLKPIALCEYLAKLIKPANDNARLLIPYSGSGSEILGAVRAGWQDITGIEKSAEYNAIAEKRIKARQ